MGAAGIFTSQLRHEGQREYAEQAAKAVFECDLGASMLDEAAPHAAVNRASIQTMRAALAA